MKNFTRFILSGACFCAPLIVAEAALAQQLKGQYSPAPKVAEEETLDVVVPRVFSSQVIDVKRAEELDQKFYSLTVVLKGYADIDATYKDRLFELLEPVHFQVTRRGKEFRKDIANAKKAVNENYKNLNKYVEQYRVDLKAALADFKPEDKSIIEKVSDEALKNYLVEANKYFDLQAQFIRTYQKLVTFLLDRNGGYYYSADDKSLSFYDAGDVQVYAKLYDTLKKINYEQVHLVRDMQSGPPL